MDLSSREIVYEVTTIGTSSKVVAIDMATGIEAAVVGPSNAIPSLRQLALKKLVLLMNKKR